MSPKEYRSVHVRSYARSDVGPQYEYDGKRFDNKDEIIDHLVNQNKVIALNNEVLREHIKDTWDRNHDPHFHPSAEEEGVDFDG